MFARGNGQFRRVEYNLAGRKEVFFYRRLKSFSIKFVVVSLLRFYSFEELKLGFFVPS